MTYPDLSPADRKALDRSLAVRPLWRGERPACDAVALPPASLLHAGPPIPDPSRAARPLLNSACVAAVFEGLAPDLEAARKAIVAGEIALRPAQDFGVVTPLAAVVSASMLLHQVCDAESGTRAYAPINGGSGPAARLGLCEMAVVEHLRWLNGPFADWLAKARRDEIDLVSIADAALAAGDDCHGRTPAGTALLSSLLAGGEDAAALDFLKRGPSFFLNLWMAACKCMLGGTAETPGSSLVVSAGGNGVETGIQVAGLPGRWFTAPAAAPRGDLGSHPPERALGAIGDSALVDVAGFGAMGMTHAPLQQQALGRFLPPDGLERPARLFAARHKAFQRVVLHSGLTARRCLDQAKTPLISLGILDARGEAGRIAGGIFEMPLEPFREAVEALDD